MKWIKKGLIFVPKNKYEWNYSHAAVPTVDAVSEMVWRIYYASRDRHNRSYTSYVEVEAGNPANLLYEHNEPILPLGKLGAFDDSGIMPSWVVTFQGKKYLFYIGWNIRKTVPYHNAIGLAISEDGGATFHKYSDGPIFGLTHAEPYFTASSCVLVENNVWKNWYLSCTKWEIINDIAEPFYHIKYAESDDGINWRREGRIAIDYDEFTDAISRPCVIKEDGLYKMFYSYRSATGYRTNPDRSYRLGYAESLNGINWTRKDDEVGIERSESGWDSEMMEYCYIHTHNQTKYLFYNGNGFGKTGIGYAVSTNF